MSLKTMFAGLVIAFPLLSSPAVAEPIVGRAYVIDGDTLEVRGIRIRLHGIDAPENGQACKDAAGQDYRCGQTAALALADRIGQRTVTCDPRETDQYGRVVAVCRTDNGDLNAWMARQDHAVAYRRYAEDYANDELTAKATRVGLWSGTFQEPSEWRRARRAGGENTRPETVAPPTKLSGCTIRHRDRHGRRLGAAGRVEHQASTEKPDRVEVGGVRGPFRRKIKTKSINYWPHYLKRCPVEKCL